MTPGHKTRRAREWAEQDRLRAWRILSVATALCADGQIAKAAAFAAAALDELVRTVPEADVIAEVRKLRAGSAPEGAS